ncbi:MAG TPA: hypothetical protein VK476_02905 [Flavobacterium sp.]|nr:hypothetical protein [Flavobacterium sp.]
MPKRFGRGGYVAKRDFQSWKKTTESNPQARHEFQWGQFTLAETLSALRMQLDAKETKMKIWRKQFPERWLLMHIASGSALCSLVASRNEPVPGRENEVSEFTAKLAHGVWSACQTCTFDYVIFFSGMVITAVPLSDNKYKFPVLKPELIERGAKVSDEFLHWTSNPQSVVEHPFLKE